MNRKDFEIITSSTSETMSIGERLVSFLPSGSTILLLGDLGAGKTTFVRGIAKGLHILDVVQSPTFNIMKIYLKGDRPLVHIDAYRLADINNDIGLDEYIGYESGITIIEWPKFIKSFLPTDCFEIVITNKGNDSRLLTFKNFPVDIMEHIVL